jgi:TolA-binding protein
MSESFADLSARARRGELSRPEQERLRIYLKSSLEARLWHESGAQLDAQDTVLPGDHDAAQRVMLRALEQFPQQRKSPRRLPLWIMVAAISLVASVAAASVAGLGYLRERKLLVQVLASAPQPSAPKAAKVAAPAPVAPPVALPSSAVVAAESLPLAVDDARPAPRSSDATSGRSESTESPAASLLGAAALARREGNTSKAIALLDSLQDQYPESREARSSDLTLGALHLKRGAAAVALRHFESYSRSSPRGALAPEALWGQYQALSSLGRKSDARARLRELLQRFPSSAYAGVARSKLQQVESTAP